MFVRVERGSAVPISRQIAEQIRAQCLGGQLKPGHRLPSVRHLAKQIGVNQNTVLRVYERLAAESLLEIRHGDGTFVAEHLPFDQLKVQRQQFIEQLTQTVQRGRLLGYSVSELRKLVSEAFHAIPNEATLPEGKQ